MFSCENRFCQFEEVPFLFCYYLKTLFASQLEKVLSEEKIDFIFIFHSYVHKGMQGKLTMIAFFPPNISPDEKVPHFASPFKTKLREKLFLCEYLSGKSEAMLLFCCCSYFDRDGGSPARDYPKPWLDFLTSDQRCDEHQRVLLC